MEDKMAQAIILKQLFDIQEDADRYPWQPFREGVEIHRLYGDGVSGAAAALLRYQPGATVPGHNHGGFEHILVLSGSQTDSNGEHGAGTLVINPPGTGHSVVSDGGCIVLAIWEKPISLWS
jgi:anti-sigma factor ChrR (cupin superfamily)